ncbi:S8 family peptidase [Lacinutrix sp. 5H-3-7-4]|uniref:S8 family peptidase n=1 Tax=Lacinutrix sp. (strain 5H-3-7-4) TaxID=983544 RepID=UPI00020A3725|nr:S8 family peptidase [Lacinutrix sp. 5H-3-7-4]AEH00832.1 peptidase S8 and S53 subtilisin kexin sedolisin [Lacinutrix sp. 5H-3-7-4]
MKLINKTVLFSVFSAAILSSCGGGAPIISTPIENIDTTPIKEAALTEAEAQNWGHLDLVKDTIPGMSVDKAYAEIIKGNKGQKIIVAVIDSGIDIEHEDLDGVLWTNKGEIAGNGIDDDKNGYVDDIHGWNFLGDAYDEQLEYIRLVASGNTTAPRYDEAKAKYDADYNNALSGKERYEGIYNRVNTAHQTLVKHFNKEDYTSKEVNAITVENAESDLGKAVETAKFMYANGMSSLQAGLKQVKGGVDYFSDQVNFNLNKDFKGRTTGDNPDDFNDKPGYGNANVMPVKKSESHGTHVAGIIAAERNNGLGANGVANNVEIMSIRAVPNGDEYDKDVAKAIRYAVDNGAKVINGSFGKSFSPHADWVRDAIKYASDNNVIFVHAAGNSSEDVDTAPNFPDDNVDYVEVGNTYIRVGALAPSYGTKMVANFSNYGKKNVDVFAPGAKIYSTTPENEYDTKGGTSMAAPAVAGVAALVWSQSPKLTAAQVKQIILDSGLAVNTKVIVGGNGEDIRDFGSLTKSGKMVNAYNALIMAAQLSK